MPTSSFDPPSASAARIAAWSDFWSDGALHARSASPDENYAGATREFWLDVFSTLAPGARVLDLCSGNGPLARLVLDAGLLRARSLELHAVDAARLAPRWWERLAPPERARVHFHPGVDAARLPFADASFDACVSQYGIEYVGPAALREVRRVLRPGGRFAAVLHHRDASLVQVVGAELQDIAWLKSGGGPVPRATGALHANDAASSAAIASSIANEIVQRAGASRWPELLQITSDAIARAFAAAAIGRSDLGLAHLQQLQRELAQIELRQRELYDAALDRDGVLALLAPLGERAPWVEALREPDGAVLGWIALADRGEG